MLKQDDIIGLSVKDLKENLEQLHSQLRKLKLSNSVSTVENPLLIRGSRRTIARIKTELRKRELLEDNQEDNK